MRVHRLDQAARERIAATLRDALAGRPEIAFSYLFGSFLEADAFRDIDVAVWTAVEAPAWTDVDLAVQLSGLVGVPVDVRHINDAPLPFLFHVLQGRLLGVGDERLLVDLIEWTARRYLDLAPLLRRATREAFAA